jgi:hypothetical protein
MSCYFRHMADLFEEAGIQVTPENRKRLDQLLHELVDVKYKNCPPTWKRIKELRADRGMRHQLVRELKARWRG